jgi:hypothetical protein
MDHMTCHGHHQIFSHNGIQYLSAVQTQNTVATFVPVAAVMEAADAETAVVDDDDVDVDAAVAVAAAVDSEKPG